jgi:hypothetical protein
MLAPCLVAFALAQGPAPTLTDAHFEASLVDGSVLRGRLAGLRLEPGGGGAVTLAGESSTELPWSRVLRLARVGATAPRPVADEALLFVGGDRLRGTVRSGDADRLDFVPTAAPDAVLQVPAARLLGIVLNPPSGESDRRALEAALADSSRENDALWLTNGDRRPGALAGLDRDRVRLESEGNETALDRSGVAAIAFNPALADPAPPPSPHLEAHLADGSLVSLSDATLDAGVLRARTRSGLELRLAVTTLAEIYPRGGSVVYLDEREPAARDFVPYLDRHPATFGVNLTWDGAPLVVRGRRHPHGLGMLPRTLLVYRLEPGDRRFQATLAVDDLAGEQANVVFRVLLDRREAYVSPPLTRLDDPVPIDVELGDARLLVLIAEFGARGDVQDHADWIEARILREAPVRP